MNFTSDCPCGRELKYSIGSAGARLTCECGRAMDVPNLMELRARANLAPAEPNLDVQVRSLLATGELPPAQCLGCGGEGPQVSFNAQCESAYIEGTGGQGVSIVLIATIGIMFGWLIAFRDDHVGKRRGRDTYIPIPVRVCRICQSTTFRQPPKTLLNQVGAALIVVAILAFILHEWLVGGIAIAIGVSLRIIATLLTNNYQRRLKQLFSSIPLYKKIFDKYPGTVVYWPGE